MFPFILLYVVLVIVRPQDYLPGFTGTPMLQIALVLAFLFWLGARSKDFSPPQYLLLAAFMVVQMVSMATNGWAGGALERLETFGPVVVAFVVLAGASSTPQRIKRVMQVLVACSVLLAIHGIDQARHGVGWTGMTPSDDGRIQYVGIFNDPNDLGLLFVMALPMACLAQCGRILPAPDLAGGRRRAAVWHLLTNSRGALLAVVAMVGVYIWMQRGLVTAMAIGIPGLLGLMMLPSRLQDLDAGESSAAGRVDAWYEGLQMFTSHPLFGVGAGNFTDYNYLTAHNSFVLVLAETGFIGFTLWFAFVATCFAMMHAVYRREQAGTLVTGNEGLAAYRGRGIALALLISLSGFFAAAFFLSRSYVILLYLLAAVVVGHYAQVRRLDPSLPAFSPASQAIRWLAMTVAAIIALYIVMRVLLVTQ